MRSRLWLLASVYGCAAAGAKMQWPSSPEPPAPSAAHEPGRGGSLTTEAPPSLPVVIQAPAPNVTTLVFSWPVPPRAINSLYGHRTDPVDGVRRFHSGVDLDGDYGQVVSAAAPGRVVQAGWRFGHGRQVVLEHAGGFRSSYSHLAHVFVEAGATLSAGQPLGYLGNSGRSTGPHLHFEIARYGDTLDPLDLLGMPLTVD